MKSVIKLGMAIVTVAILFTSCQKEPSACFKMDKTEVTAGEKVTLTNCSVDAKTYKWTFPDKSTATAENIEYTPLDAGSHTIKLEAFSKNGKKTDEITQTLTVKEAMGQVSFWNMYATDYPIDVTISNQMKTINKSFSSSPSDCNQMGNANFNLAVGSYSYSAQDDVGTLWNGNITITKDGCLLLELVD